MKVLLGLALAVWAANAPRQERPAPPVPRLGVVRPAVLAGAAQSVRSAPAGGALVLAERGGALADGAAAPAGEAAPALSIPQLQEKLSADYAPPQADAAGRGVFDKAARVEALAEPSPTPGWVRRVLTLGLAKPRVLEQRSVGRVFDERTARQLSSLSSLSEPEADGLIGWLGRVEIPWTGALPFPSDTTFSLELELLTHRQMDAALIERLTGRLGADERRDWELHRNLPRKRWVKMNKHVVGRIEAALPKGWTLEKQSGENRWKETSTFEIRTANAKGVYHANTGRDWSELIAGLEAVQRVLPGGLYSVHLHVGRLSKKAAQRDRWTEKLVKLLDAPPGRFMSVVASQESLWRGLMGVPFSRDSGLGYSPSLLFDGGSEWTARDHSRWVNLSGRLPTMEHKNVTYLLKGKKLSPERLRQDLWASFALFDYVLRGEPEMRSPGLPLPAGMKPSRKQIMLFLDDVFGSDLVGKALALQRLVPLTAEAPGEHDEYRRKDGRQLYKEHGLEVLWDLHAAHDGRDDRLARHLRADGGRLLRKLADDLKSKGRSAEAAFPFLPAEIRPQLKGEFARPSPAAAEPLPLAAGAVSL